MRAKTLLIVLGLILWVCLIYSNSFKVPFLFDDLPILVEGLFTTAQSGWPSFWQNRGLGYITFAANFKLHGLDLFGYHAVNLGIHLLSGIFVWLITAELAKKKVPGQLPPQVTKLFALGSGLFFLSHPLQTQAVTYIVQRVASLAGMFYLVAVYAFIKVRHETGRNKFMWLVVMGLSTLAACQTKESSFSLPLAWLLVELSFFRENQKFSLKKHAKLIMTTVGLMLFGVWVIWHRAGWWAIFGSKVSPLNETISWWVYGLTQLRVIQTYFRLMIFPVGQNLDHYFPVSTTWLDGGVLFGAGLIGLLTWIAIKTWQTQRWISFSLGWMGITLLIESSIVPIADVIFEHRLYLTLLGFSWLAVGGLLQLLQSAAGKKWRGLIILVIAGAYGFMTFQRNKIWANEFTLWGDVVHKSPQKARGYFSLGTAIMNQGDYQLAEQFLLKSVELQSQDIFFGNNLGVLYKRMGEFSKAKEVLEKVNQQNPRYIPAMLNLYVVHQELGEPELAREILDQAARQNPDHPGVKLLQSKIDTQ